MPSLENAILQDLYKTVESIITMLRKEWPKARNANKPMERFVITWPTTPIKDDRGRSFHQPCLTKLQEQHETLRVLPGVIERTAAYAFLYVNPKKEGPELHLETPHGTRTWTLPAVRRGDVWALGSMEVETNKSSFNLLWKKTPIQA